MDNIKSELICVCANCKKVKDKGGLWKEMGELAGAVDEWRVSHGICGPCMKKLYPQWAEGGTADPEETAAGA